MQRPSILDSSLGFRSAAIILPFWLDGPGDELGDPGPGMVFLENGLVIVETGSVFLETDLICDPGDGLGGPGDRFGVPDHEDLPGTYFLGRTNKMQTFLQ